MYADQLPKFLRYSDPMLRYVEYHAIRRIYANGDEALMAQRYPEMSAQIPEIETNFIISELNTFKGQALDMLFEGVFDNEYASFAMMNFFRFMESEGKIVPDSYPEEIIETPQSKANKPSPTKAQKNINAEIKKKKRDQRSLARENHQRKTLGDEALVNKDLYKEARRAVFEHLKVGGKREDLLEMALDLAKDNELTDLQTKTLCNEIMLPYFDKLNIHNNIEFELLKNPNNLKKTIFYFWHQLSHIYEKDVEFPLSQEHGVKMASCSKSTYPECIDAMQKMKIIKKISIGRKGAKSKTASVYKLLVKPTGK